MADDALFQVDAVKNWSTTVLSSGLSVEFYARTSRSALSSRSDVRHRGDVDCQLCSTARAAVSLR